MTEKKKETLEKPLTEVELELMTVIWSLGECTVKDVQAGMPKGRDLAYTSVATMMKILEQKGAVGSQKKERAHTYVPRVTREDYESSSLRHLAKNLFHSSPTSMVARLVNDGDLSKAELRAIQKLLDERLGK